MRALRTQRKFASEAAPRSVVAGLELIEDRAHAFSPSSGPFIRRRCWTRRHEMRKVTLSSSSETSRWLLMPARWV
jgi:hypothetical protein